jgi:hypothetical protein
VELKRKIAVGALAALAAGIGVGTAVPTSSNPAAGVAPIAVSYTTPVAGEQPRDKTGKGSDKRDSVMRDSVKRDSDKRDSDKAGEHSDKRDSGKRDSDNVQHEGTGDEGK